jgi:hypothetical protein
LDRYHLTTLIDRAGFVPRHHAAAKICNEETADTKIGPLSAGLFEFSKVLPTAVMPMATMMPAAVPATMTTSPPDFGGIGPGILLHRRSGAGIAERQRLGAFARSGENEQCANGGKPKNFGCGYFRHLHLWSPWVHVSRIDATQLRC